MTAPEAKDKIASQTDYNTWENIRQELRGTDQYEEFLEDVIRMVSASKDKEIAELKNMEWIKFEDRQPEFRERVWLFNGLYAQTGKFLEKNAFGFLCWETGSEIGTCNFKFWYPVRHPKI